MSKTQIQIDFKGLDEVVRKMAGGGDIVKKHLQLALNASLMKVKESARAESPVITGRLRGGIEDFPPKGSEEKGWVKSTVFYGEYVHKRNPFMTRGMENSREDVKSIFQQSINNIKAALS